MKVALAGAFGHLGYDILKKLLADGHDVVALDLKEPENYPEKGKVEFHAIDVTNKDTLVGTMKGCKALITTVGLVKKSATLTNYDVDLNGNLNLLEEAKKSGAKKVVYISVIHADTAPDVPMLEAKHQFEEKLKESGLDYAIVRPTGYFYDIAHVFMPMIEKGKVSLLGHKDHPVNVIDTPDLAAFTVEKLTDKENGTYSVGGKEIYTYKEIATMFFEAAGKKVKISRAPVFLFSLLIKAASKKNDGSEALIRFSKWTLTHDMVGEVKYGDASFKEYVSSLYKKEGK